MRIKTLLIAFILGIVLTACGSNDEETNHEQTNENSESNEVSEKDIYEVGDTVSTKAGDSFRKFSLTLHDISVVDGEYEGYTYEDVLVESSISESDTRFYIANVTIKNEDDQAFVPLEHIHTYLFTEDYNVRTENIGKAENKLAEELDPGEEVTDDFVFTDDYIQNYDEALFIINYHSDDYRIEFEFEVPKDE